MRWIEVTLDLKADLAEPASELLSRVAPNGVAIEMLDEEVRVRAWLPDDADLATRRRRLDEGLWHLGQIEPFPEPSFHRIEGDDWEESWKQQYQPLELGERLLILPSWMQPDPPVYSERSDAVYSERSDTVYSERSDTVYSERSDTVYSERSDTASRQRSDPSSSEPQAENHADSLDHERTAIYLEPGMAFGTGAHSTTRDCLELLEAIVEPGDSVVDLGCGSGILAISAARLGAGQVVALDVDSKAVELARENVRKNRVEARVSVVHGSLPELKLREFRLILANIQASVLRSLLEDGLADIVSKQGVAILSGILEEQLELVATTAESNGFTKEQVKSTGDWRTLVLRKP